MNYYRHLRSITIAVVGLLLMAVLLLYLEHEYHYEFFLHLAAVLIEISLSMVLLEVYLARSKARESFRIYSLARNYIFQKIYLQFNDIFSRVLHGTQYLEKLGHAPSFRPQVLKSGLFEQIARDFINGCSEADLIEILNILSTNFEEIERFANSNLVYHNEDLFASLTRFLDLTYTINLFRLSNISDKNIVSAIHGQTTLLNLTPTAYELFVELIQTWLYMMNNFIYFSDSPSHVERRTFRFFNGQVK